VSEDDPARLVAALHERLRETGERPVEREASRWLGEAEAVAGDLAGAAVDPEVRRERVAHVAELLSHVDGTGDPVADEQVAAAREVAAELLGSGESAGGDDPQGRGDGARDA